MINGPKYAHVTGIEMWRESSADNSAFQERKKFLICLITCKQKICSYLFYFYFLELTSILNFMPRFILLCKFNVPNQINWKIFYAIFCISSLLCTIIAYCFTKCISSIAELMQRKSKPIGWRMSRALESRASWANAALLRHQHLPTNALVVNLLWRDVRHNSKRAAVQKNQARLVLFEKKM